MEPGEVGVEHTDTLAPPDLPALPCVEQDPAERALAARYAPILRFDVREPFLPLAAGYTLFRRDGPSPSFSRGRQVELAPEGEPPASLAVEYAIWWDWDIGHLYELEHVWVFVDDAGRVVRGEASWHGQYRDLRLDGALALEGEHLVIYSEPGKHAFAPTPAWFAERRRRFKRSETGTLAGVSGVLISPYIAGRVQATPLNNRLAHTYLARHAFEPGGDFSQVFRFAPEMLVPWPALRDWMPARVNAWLDYLARAIPPADYRFLRIAQCGAAARAIRRAAALGADAVTFAADCRKRRFSLAEAIAVCKEEQLGIYVELEDGAAVPAVVETLREQEYAEHSIVGAFRPDWLAAVKAAAPEIITSAMFDSPDLDAVPLARAARANFVHPRWERLPRPSALLMPEWAARVREAGLGILCGPEERREELAALRRIGVDGICSRAPELLVA